MITIVVLQIMDKDTYINIYLNGGRIDDDEESRIFCNSDSTISISEISQKFRRGSFFIKWDPSLVVPKSLKKMRKDRLNLSQNDFCALEYQLYCCGILSPRKNFMYMYGARNVQLKNEVYEKLIRFLDVWQVYNMCIWRHYNLTMTMPDNDMITMFNLSAKEMEKETGHQVKKMTQMAINDNYTLRRAKWSVTQRLAAQHTRDFFLYDFDIKKPMLCDLKCTQDNNDMIREFILALLKADVSIETIKDICYAQLYGMPEVPKMVVELDFEEMSKKEKMEMPVQRSSITDFSPVKEEVVAATKLQRAYRKRLNKLKDAVRRIEVWWEPRRLEIIEIRYEVAQEMEEAVNNLSAHRDLFQYKELVEEIKNDYKTVRHPETRTIKYWLKVIMILTVPVALGILLGKLYINSAGVVILYLIFQYLTVYRKLWKVLWFQTMVLWLFTVVVLNNCLIEDDGWIRIPVWVFVVAVGRKRWIPLFLVTLVIRIGLALFYDTFSIQPTEYGLVVYDVYCMATIAAASRQGKPIEMLHKVVINVLFLIIIAFSGAVGCFYGCIISN